MKDVLQKEIDDVISLEKAKKGSKEGIKQVGV